MTRLLALIVLLSLLGCVATALGPTMSGAPDDVVIRDLEEQERLAVLKRDSQALQRLWAEEFIVNAPMNQISPNRAVVLDLIRQGRIHYSTLERRIEQLRVTGDLAVVMGGETVQPIVTAAGAAPPVQRRFTHIWRREAGAWRLIARHANNVPPVKE
jgi:ketosteroid isomerase-like protein